MRVDKDKLSDTQKEEIVEFFNENNCLFVDPFSGHVDINEYMEKLFTHAEIIICKQSNEICGMICAYMNDEKERNGYIQVVLVKREFQNSGIGKKLLSEVIYLAKEKKLKKLNLNVDVENEVAQGLFKKFGFIYSNTKHSNEKKRIMELDLDSVIDVKQAQERLLEMGKKIHDILTENEIPYMITYGTLLGAVRHKGFIPWDDDFDLFLFGDTYEKAIHVLRENLPDDMFLEDQKSEPLFFHSWAHVKDMNTVTVCDQFPQDNIYAHKGLSIDLYVAYKMQENQVDLFRLKENKLYQERKHRVNLIDDKTLFEITRKLDKQIDEYVIDNNLTKDVYGMVLDERIMYEEEIFPLKKYVFEDTEFWGPSNYDLLLTRFYNKYMELPPESDRKPHYSIIKNNN